MFSNIFKSYGIFYALIFIFALLLTPNSASSAADSKTTPQKALYGTLQPDEFMTRWMVAGPVPVFSGKPDPADTDTQRKAFRDELVNIKAIGASLERRSLKIGEKNYSWQPVESKEDIVDLAKTFGDTNFVIAYAWAEFQMPEPQIILLGIGSDDGIRIWLNGKLVHDNWIGRATRKDDDIVPLAVEKGRNQLLLKIQNMEQAWSFSCRMLGPSTLQGKMVEAAKRGNLDNLRVLLDNGVHVNAKIDPGITALHAAKIYGREDVEKLLLEKGADSGIPMPGKEILVDAIFKKAIKDNYPGAAVLVSRNGETLYEKCFGYANLGYHIPITSQTKFRIGSVSKQFTAAAILKLQEERKLSVRDTLSKFIPDFPRGNEVTIHHLLTHTSGIHSYTDNPDFLKTAASEVKPEELIESIKKDPFDFNPGENWKYNNSGYFILGYIVKKISGQPLEEYLKKNFFEPLGMKDTGTHRHNLILENEAEGYSYIDGKIQKAVDWDMSRAGGAGALYSTVEDLHKWNEAVFNGKILGESSLRAAFTPALLSNGTLPQTLASGGYGYGWGIGEVRGLKEISHGGGLHGFISQLSRYPEQNLTVVVLTNAAPPLPDLGPSAAAQDIAAIYLWDQMDKTISYAVDASADPKLFDDYAGKFEYPGGAILTVTNEEGHLFAQLSGQPKFEIFPRSENEFFWKVTEARIQFVRDETGEVRHAIHYQGGRELKVPRIEEEIPAELDPASYDQYTGEYELGQGITITVTREGD
ncbi:MAG: serine hydrolase, partial [Calditrichia bacterium]